MRRTLAADAAFYISSFGASLASDVSFTVAAVYFVVEAGLNPLQLVLVGTAMELAILIFEIPTGVVADTYGRRLSIIIGLLVTGAGMILVGSVASFAVILAGYAIWGLGHTFISGAAEAWITDEVGVERVGRVFARGQQLAYAGTLVAIPISVAIATVDLGLAVAVGGVLTLTVAVFCAVAMPETAFVRRPRAERSAALTELRVTAMTGARFVRGRPLLLLIVAVAVFAGASTESFDRLWEAHFLLDVGLPKLGSLDPVVWFGVFAASTAVTGIVASHALVRRFERVGQQELARTLLSATVVQVAGVVAFALAGMLWLAAAAFWLYYATRSVTGPVYTTWLNENIADSSVRATVNSISGQADAIGQVAGGPALGGLGTVFSLRTALLAGGSLLVPAIALYARAIRHDGVERELNELAEPAAIR